jgi:hypothetical protein
MLFAMHDRIKLHEHVLRWNWRVRQRLRDPTVVSACDVHDRRFRNLHVGGRCVL